MTYSVGFLLLMSNINALNIPLKARDVAVAQFVLESNSGNSRLARECKNYGGIKNKSRVGFKCYLTELEFLKDYESLVMSKRYFKCLNFKTYDKIITCIAKSGYCPEKSYPKKVLELINEF